MEVAQRTVRLLPMQRAGGQLLGVIRTTVVWSRASPPCPRGGSERSTWPAESCDQGGWKRGCTVLDGHGIDCYVATASRTRSARVGGTDPSRTCDWAVCAVSWWWRWMQWRRVWCALPQGDTTYRGTPSRPDVPANLTFARPTRGASPTHLWPLSHHLFRLAPRSPPPRPSGTPRTAAFSARGPLHESASTHDGAGCVVL